jgi:hypothetical protein
VGYQVEFRRAYAWQVNGSTPLPAENRWTVPQVLGPQQLPGSPAPPPLATTGQTSVYEWQQLEGGYFYQVRIRALNRGEWFQGGDNSRIGPFSAWASRQPTDQPWSTAFYAVTKPDQPSINIQLTADPLNSQCVKMRWIGQGGQYRWEPIETGPDAYQHRNGLKYDYMRMAFHFEVVNRANPNQQIIAFDHLIPIDQAIGDIRYCNAAFTGNTRSVRVRPAYASWDSPGESLYNASLTNEGMIIGQYGPASNLVNVTA